MPHEVTCQFCQKRVLASSIDFHTKACKRKFDESHSRCPGCGLLISNDDWSPHQETCEKTMKALRDKRAELGQPQQQGKSAAPTPAAAASETKEAKTESKDSLRGAPLGPKMKRTMINGRLELVPDLSASLTVSKVAAPSVAPAAEPTPAASASAAAASTSATTKCEECDAADATVRCNECEQNLCEGCAAKLHEKGARARHTRVPLNSALDAPAPCSSSSAAVAAPSEPAEPKRPEKPATAAAAPSAADEVQTVALVKCRFCNRGFQVDRVYVHEKVCSTAGQKKRKVYNADEKRIEGTDFAEFKNRRSETPPEVLKWKKHGRRWRQEEAMLRDIVTQSQMINEFKAAGRPLSEMPPPPAPSAAAEENDTRVLCHFCNRRFSPEVAEKHIPHCKTTINRPKPPPGGAASVSKTATASRKATKPTAVTVHPPAPAVSHKPAAAAAASKTARAKPTQQQQHKAVAPVPAPAPSLPRRSSGSKIVTTSKIVVSAKPPRASSATRTRESTASASASTKPTAVAERPAAEKPPLPRSSSGSLRSSPEPAAAVAPVVPAAPSPPPTVPAIRPGSKEIKFEAPPSSIDEYRERERLRREARSKGIAVITPDTEAAASEPSPASDRKQTGRASPPPPPAPSLPPSAPPPAAVKPSAPSPKSACVTHVALQKTVAAAPAPPRPAPPPAAAAEPPARGGKAIHADDREAIAALRARMFEKH